MKTTLVLGTATGGAGTHVRDLAYSLVARGHTVTVAAPAATQERFRFTDGGAHFRPVHITAAPRPAADLAAVRALRTAVADSDIVHAHGVRAGAFTALALIGRKTPAVVTLHNTVLAQGLKARLLTGLETLAVRRAAVVLGASGDLVDRARTLGARDARLGPIPAPPLPAPTRTRAEVRAELGLEDDRLLALAVGRLAPQKDYPTLLAAAALWQKTTASSDPAAHTDAPNTSATRPPYLAVAGDGPLLDTLRAEAGRLGLDAALLGHRSDVADLLAAADLLVLSSTWEARALVVQEAMHTGVPVVATAVGGLPDLAGDAALLVPPADPAAIAGAVAHLTDPAARAALADAGRKQAASWPDAQQCLALVADLYEELTGASR